MTRIEGMIGRLLDNQESDQRELWIDGQFFTYIKLDRLNQLKNEKDTWLYQRWQGDRKFGYFRQARDEIKV